jgi:lambda repressor-like predicted transcriptional regulator
MEPKEIKIELIRTGTTQTQIARALNVSSSIVQRVIFRKATSRPVAKAVAAAIGLPFEQVFPEYAEPCGRRSAACA